MTQSIETRRVEQLTLDDHNPRLPESYRGRDQESLIKYLLDYGNLGELAQSFADNGFFPTEPLVVDPRGVVLEGNRRVATLKILLGLCSIRPEELGVSIDSARLDGLKIVPVVEVNSREEADRFIAFRHIGGLKQWEPEAKSRYIFGAISKLRQEGDLNPFNTLAARVGTNRQAIRASYLAVALLKHARDEFGIDVGHVERDRFGVWIRAMSSPDIRGFMGLRDEAKDVAGLDAAISGSTEQGLRQVIDDLTPKDGEDRARIYDSRQLSIYGKILANVRARTVFARFGFDAAERVVSSELLHIRIQKLSNGVSEVLESVSDSTEAATQSSFDESKRLRSLAGSLFATLQEKLTPDE